MLSVAGKKRFYCEHCSEYISKTLFYQHKRQFYDAARKKWHYTRVPFVPSGGTSTSSSYDVAMAHPDNYDAYEDLNSEYI